MTTQLGAPRPLYGWAQPTQADDWTPGAQEPRTLASDAILDASDVIPGLRLRLNDVW